MKESYSEGITNHTGPESCVGFPQGGGEALTGVCTGRDIEPRNVYSVGADRFKELWKATSNGPLS